MNKIINIEPGLTFDDVLIVPSHRYSPHLKSRKDIDLRTNIEIGTPKNWSLAVFNNPLIPANMSSIISRPLVDFCLEQKSLVVLDRPNLYNPEFQNLPIFYSIGHKDCDNLEEIYKNNSRMLGFNLELAHLTSFVGHSALTKLQKFKNSSHFAIMAGNVATPQQVEVLLNYNVNFIKVGVGAGSVCTTRTQTGVGYPQLQAILDIKSNQEIIDHPNKTWALISDGGIREPGDMCKALAAGADFVMAGGIFAGTDLTQQTEYYGMASSKGKEISGIDSSSFIEGAIQQTGNRGKTEDVFNSYMDGLRSAISYSGNSSLHFYKHSAKFTKVTPSTTKENKLFKWS